MKPQGQIARSLRHLQKTIAQRVDLHAKQDPDWARRAKAAKKMLSSAEGVRAPAGEIDFYRSQLEEILREKGLLEVPEPA